ncbi:MAG: phenylalanine--tRNA ligase subunit beta [Thermodesulfobacteriota bacterium]
MKINYNWLKEYIDPNVSPEKLSDILTMAGLEVEETQLVDGDDCIFDVNVTPNRPDCLSILGMAREVAAITGGKLTVPSWQPEEVDADIKDHIMVEIRDSANCARYAARLIRNVRVGESPSWLKKKIEGLGFRSVNNIVDVTNYVMLDRGQPLHAFDYQSIEGKTVIIRSARPGEKVTTLDGNERTLNDSTLVIADKKNVLAVAGIIGGLDSEVTVDTDTVLLESAYFNPLSIRRSSKRLGIKTEASYRFERGADPCDNIKEALNEAAELVATVAGGEVTKGIIDAEAGKLTPPSIRWRPDFTNKLLGTGIKKEDMINYLTALNCEVKPTNDSNILFITPPSYRVDLLNEIDLTEEIARLYNYDNIPLTVPRISISSVKKERDLTLEDRLKTSMIDMGFLEVINYSFVSPESLTRFGFKAEKDIVEILNPLTEEQSVMRPSLVPSLCENLSFNIKHNNYDLKIFELSRVFFKGTGCLSEERKKLAGLWFGMRYTESWNLSGDMVDFFDLKGVLENLFEHINLAEYTFLPKRDLSYTHPARTASITVDGIEIGYMGKIHPELSEGLDIQQPLFIFELDFDSLLRYSVQHKRYEDIPRFPGVSRDVAVLVDEELSAADIENTIRHIGEGLVDSVKIFDLYKGDGIPVGKKSVAYRIRYLSRERTLIDEEVSSFHNRLVKEIKRQFKAEVR